MRATVTLAMRCLASFPPADVPSFTDAQAGQVMRNSRSANLLTALAGWLLCISGVHADPAPRGEPAVAAHDAWAFKLTPSYYVTSGLADAIDLNLRGSLGAHAFWLAHYRRAAEFEQTRIGYEYTAHLPVGQLIPSLQLASHGFAGASLNAQIGDSVYALLGLGRTNLRDYYNLNFDPNDSLVVGLGTRLLPKSNVSLYTVRDNRLATGQKVIHLVWRYTPDDQQRWTVDLSARHGRPSADAEAVSGHALSLTYDYRNVFVRLARDRRVNFTDADQTRMSIGLRF